MRKITYFENLRKEIRNQGRPYVNTLTREEFEALRGYEEARKINFDYPILTDVMFCNAGLIGEAYTKARVGKFVFATASTSAVNSIAQLFSHGYKIVDVIDLKQVLGDYSYVTSCDYGLLFARKS